jgi:hypothetical protein
MPNSTLHKIQTVLAQLIVSVTGHTYLIGTSQNARKQIENRNLNELLACSHIFLVPNVKYHGARMSKPIS